MISVGLLFLAVTLVQAADADPLLPARSGQLQCYTPDQARKTCHSLAAYEPDGDVNGQVVYINRAEIPLTADGSVTMTTSAPVFIRSGAVCGLVQPPDVESAEVRASGALVPVDRAIPILRQVAQAMAPFSGQEICTRYRQHGDGLVAEASMGGTRRPDLDQAVIWVDPSAGYRVSQ